MTAIKPEGQVDAAEQALKDQSAIQAAARNLLKRQEERQLAEMVKAIDGMVEPIREGVPEFNQEPNERRASITTRSPTHPLYRKFSDAEREWRSPDSDHWVAEWIRGKYHKDVARMLVAQEKLEGIYGRATLAEGVADASGGFATGTGASLIPRPLEAVVMIARDRVAKMRRFASFYPMTAQEHNIPTAAAMTAYMTGESATATAGEPTVSQVALIAKKAQATGLVTKELLDDAAINVVSVMATRGGGALGVLEDNQFFSDGAGTGNTVTKITGTTFTETTSGAYAYSLDALRQYYAVNQVYRSNAIWMVAANVLQLLAAVKDGQGRPFYQGLEDKPGPITDDATAEGTILRRPVYEVPFPNGTIWFGDPAAAYAIGQRQGVTMEVSDQVKFDTDEIMFKITERIAGIPVDTVAAQLCAGITSATSL